MKNKPRSKNMQASKDTPLKKNGTEEKLHAAVQKLRNSPSAMVGILLLTYFVIRMIFSV